MVMSSRATNILILILFTNFPQIHSEECIFRLIERRGVIPNHYIKRTHGILVTTCSLHCTNDAKCGVIAILRNNCVLLEDQGRYESGGTWAIYKKVICLYYFPSLCYISPWLRNLLLSLRNLLPSLRNLLPSSRHVLPSLRHPLQSLRHLLPSLRHLPPSLRNLLPSLRNLLPLLRNLLPLLRNLLP